MKKTFKTIIAFMLITCFMLALGACKTDSSNKDQPNGSVSASSDTDAGSDTGSAYTPKVMALKGPTGMGMSQLLDGGGEQSYEITLTSAPDEVVSAFVSNSVDIAAVPINLASTLYNKLDGDMQMLAVNTLGVLYILENGDSIETISDLEGKTIHATGQASTPEYILNYIIEKNDLKDVTIEYHADHSELATLMAAGDVEIGMLPEPHVTASMAKNDELRIALDLTEEWENVSDAELAQGCIVARKSFIEENPAVISTFLTDYEASVSFTNENKEDAAKIIEEYGIMAKAALAVKAIDNCNIVCLTGEEMKSTAIGMFEVLFDANPKSIGGALPAEDFYYIAK